MFDWNWWYETFKKVMDPDYDNELGNKHFLRIWAKL